MNASRLATSMALVAASLMIVGTGAWAATAASAPAASASGDAASAPASRRPARACASRAGASAAAGARTSKLRHIPDEEDPCAASTGAEPKTRP